MTKTQLNELCEIYNNEDIPGLSGPEQLLVLLSIKKELIQSGSYFEDEATHKIYAYDSRIDMDDNSDEVRSFDCEDLFLNEASERDI